MKNKQNNSIIIWNYNFLFAADERKPTSLGLVYVFVSFNCQQNVIAMNKMEL